MGRPPLQMHQLSTHVLGKHKAVQALCDGALCRMSEQLWWTSTSIATCPMGWPERRGLHQETPLLRCPCVCVLSCTALCTIACSQVVRTLFYNSRGALKYVLVALAHDEG